MQHIHIHRPRTYTVQKYRFAEHSSDNLLKCAINCDDIPSLLVDTVSKDNKHKCEGNHGSNR